MGYRLFQLHVVPDAQPDSEGHWIERVVPAQWPGDEAAQPHMLPEPPTNDYVPMPGFHVVAIQEVTPGPANQPGTMGGPELPVPVRPGGRPQASLEREHKQSRWDAAIKALNEAKEGSRELDQMCWAAANAHNYPLAHYDLDVWEQALREGAVEATLSTSIESTLRFMAQTWPDVRVQFASTRRLTTADVRIPQGAVSVEARVQRELPFAGASVALAEAFARAHQEALKLEQERLLESDLTPKP